jgi:hypothetical protein
MWYPGSEKGISMNNNHSHEFKSFARQVSQSKLPDSRLFKAEIQTAITEAIKAADILSDKLYILENFLDDAREAEE